MLQKEVHYPQHCSSVFNHVVEVVEALKGNGRHCVGGRELSGGLFADGFFGVSNISIDWCSDELCLKVETPINSKPIKVYVNALRRLTEDGRVT